MELTEYMNNAIGRIFQNAILSLHFNTKEIRFLRRTAIEQKAAAKKTQGAGERGRRTRGASELCGKRQL